MRPNLFVTAEKLEGLRSVDELRAFVETEVGKSIWDPMLDYLHGFMTYPPFTPKTPFKGRNPKFVEMGENDHTLSFSTGQRVLCGALVHLVTGEARYRDDAVAQLECAFDEDAWPEWRHGVNAGKGLGVDHRVGNFILQFSMAYDWLHAFLSSDERRRIVEGLDRRGIRPALASMEKDGFWKTYSNWSGKIVTGLGLFGMAAGDEHPRSQELIDYAAPWMGRYMDALGPEGEFNESPAYAGSLIDAVIFYNACRYHARGADDALRATRLGAYGHCYATHSLPPGHMVAFGDGGKGHAPNAVMFCALADQLGDGVLQWFYTQYRGRRRHLFYPMELLSVNPDIEPVSPEGRWPLGRAFSGYAQPAISRSSWDPVAPACVVCGKAAHGFEERREAGDGAWYHLDLDAGQITIDGYGEPLVVDLGSSGGYGPANVYRGDNYGKGTFGHNVLMIGGRNTLELGATRPHMVASAFDDDRGGWWQADLTGAYEGAKAVRRTVVHLHPGIVVVVDEAELERAEEISLRWHTVDRCEPDSEGSFTIEAEEVRCAGRVVRLGGEEASVERREHAYEPPYGVDYYGMERPQVHESCVEAIAKDDRATFLSLFCVYGPGETVGRWSEEDGVWSIALPDGAAQVSVTEDGIEVRNTGTGKGWEVGRDGGG